MTQRERSTPRRSQHLHLRDGWAVLTRTIGISWESISRTRAGAIKAHVDWVGVGDWRHRQKMGDVTIKISIYGRLK